MHKNAAKVFSAFFPNRKIAAVEPLSSGLINTTYRIDCPDGSYLLQRLNTKIFPRPAHITENVEKAAAHLQKKNYPKQILRFLPTAAGLPFHTDKKGEVWRLSVYFANTLTLDKPENTEQVFNAAAAYGEFLRYLSDLSPSKMHVIIPDFHNADLRMQQFVNALKNADAEKKNAVQEEIREIQNALPFLQKMNTLQLPLRITHNDTKISNLLFAADRTTPVAVIDWDTLMPGTILSDFGDIVRTFCSTASENEKNLKEVIFREDYYRAAAEGFLSEAKTMLNETEKANLRNGAKRVILVQAMRFLTDFLNGNIYYATTYAEQNADRTKNQLQLFRSL